MDDTDEYKESFLELLRLDDLSRAAIEDRKNTIAADIRHDEAETASSYSRIKEHIRDIVTQATVNGEMKTERAQNVMEVLESSIAKPYYKQMQQAHAAYTGQNNQNIDELVKSIEMIGGMISPQKEERENDDKDAEMTLVGAMFITENGFVLNPAD